jgi:hypothetical protein
MAEFIATVGAIILDLPDDESVDSSEAAVELILIQSSSFNHLDFFEF